jgi:hypothetical protein
MLFGTDSEYFYRTEMTDGKKHDLPKIAHNIGEKNPSVSMRIELSTNSLVHRYDLKEDASWQVLDSEDKRDRPSLNQGKPRSFADGRFGFLLQGSDDIVEISSFQFTPRTGTESNGRNGCTR